MNRLKYVVPALCLATLALSSAAAHADGLNLAPYVNQTINMQVEPYASAESNGSFYVGLTDVNLTTLGGATIGSLEAFCDDFNDEITVPDTYAVTVTAINSTTPLLEEAAYYGLMFGTTPSGNSTMDSDIQELIWNLTAPGTYSMNAEMTTLYDQMMANYASTSYTGDYYFNADGDGGQSFMYTDPAPTPEPPTLLTLATGLIAMAFFARRRAALKA